MGLILPQEVEVRVNSNNVKHYNSIGYNCNNKDTIIISPLELPVNSKIVVKYKCDYCEKEFVDKINKYYISAKSNCNKVCCCNCISFKRSEVACINKEVIFLYRDKEWLYNQYIINNKSADEIAKECGIDVRNLRIWLQKYNITKYVSFHEKLSKELLYQLYVKEKKTIFEIEKLYHCSLKSIHKLLSDYEIKERSTKENFEVYYNEKNGRQIKSLKAKEVWQNQDFKIYHKQRMRETCCTTIHKIKLSASLQGIPVNEWNDFLLSENNRIRKSIDYKEWVKNVFERDNYTCQCCGAKNGEGKRIVLNAHHIKNFAEYPELRMDIDNGITLCEECHLSRYENSFHKIYGSKNNTKEQLDKYIKDYKESEE